MPWRGPSDHEEVGQRFLANVIHRSEELLRNADHRDRIAAGDDTGWRRPEMKHVVILRSKAVAAIIEPTVDNAATYELVEAFQGALRVLGKNPIDGILVGVDKHQAAFVRLDGVRNYPDGGFGVCDGVLEPGCVPSHGIERTSVMLGIEKSVPYISIHLFWGTMSYLRNLENNATSFLCPNRDSLFTNRQILLVSARQSNSPHSFVKAPTLSYQRISL